MRITEDRSNTMKYFNDFNEMYNKQSGKNILSVFNTINSWGSGWVVLFKDIPFCFIDCDSVDAVSCYDGEEFDELGYDWREIDSLDEDVDRAFDDFCNAKGYEFDKELAYERGGNPLKQPLSTDDGREFAEIVEGMVADFIAYNNGNGNALSQPTKDSLKQMHVFRI